MLACTSAGVLGAIGALAGIILFACSANSMAPRLAALWNPPAPAAWAEPGRELVRFLHRYDIGPGVFQDHPFACVGLLAACLGAGLVLAWLARGLTACRWMPRSFHAWNPAPARTLCREAGRLFGIWETLAGEHGSLRRKTVSGSQYQLVFAGVKMLCDTVRMAVFGWILAASDYGLYTLVMIVITVLDSFSGLGLDIMIQRDGEDVEERLPVYWTVQMVRGIALFTIAWFGAPMVADFYRDQLVHSRYAPQFFIGLTRFMATVFLLRGAAGFGREMRQRAMDFRAVILWDIASALATLAGSLLMLFWTRNVLALAAYMYLGALTRFGGSYLLYRWKPRLAWNGRVARQILLFSSSIVAITLLNSIAGRVDHATVAKVLGMAALGFYGRAYGLATIPSQSFSNVIAPVMLPALRAVAHQPERFRRAFLKALAVYAGGSLLMAGAFALMARPLVQYVFGQNGYWLPMLPPLYVLLLFGVFRAVGALTPSALFVMNKPWWVALCTGVFAAGVAGGVVPMTLWFGVVGTAWTVVLASALSNGLAVALVVGQLNRECAAAARAGLAS